ncbi:DUF4190 domain-containing protein [Cryobacterium sp. MLB-32]|uniref:DUF4190 domain-containing protein n=1 Tax=Cryobacterium sp. MLB-32 TaxID=1529318 RepID=UPI00068EC342|nr:DUF4190 domain-containing protein [Cryobacterium sp. MLB-32]
MSDPTGNTPPSQPPNDSTPAVVPSVPPVVVPTYQAQPAPIYAAPAAPGQLSDGQGSDGQPTAPPPFNVLSIVSFVSAFVVSLAAVICGHIALSQIKKTGERGRGFAIAGLVLGYIGLVSGIIAIILFFVFLSILATNPNYNPYGNF